MRYGFLDIASTPSVRAAQAANGSAELWSEGRGDRSFDRFTAAEAAFIASRDSFYLATVSETGWPYVQHRGGPPASCVCWTIGHWPSRIFGAIGNTSPSGTSRQATGPPVPHGLPAASPTKIYAHAEMRDLTADPDLAERLAMPPTVVGRASLRPQARSL